MMDYEEMEQLLQYDERENDIFLPNEIFIDLKILADKGSSHVAFAYSYYYLICWLYRYTKYGSISVDIKTIKRILGYNPNYKDINYIIKKNGILDQMQYTSTDTNYPISWSFESNLLEFTYLNEMDRYVNELFRNKKGRNFKVKCPIKGFNRHWDNNELRKEYEKGYQDGTFFFIDNTHLITFDTFLFCMSNKNIGRIGFYLYGFLKMKNQQHRDGYDVSLKELENETNIKGRTLNKYLDSLKKYRMIETIHNQDFFTVGLKKEERKSNTYKTNDLILFLDRPKRYDKIKVIKHEEYLQILKNKDAVIK